MVLIKQIGKEYIMASKKYDDNLKQKVIEAVQAREGSMAQIARDYGISKSAVYEWVRQFKQKENKVLIPKANESLEQENKRLKKELKQAQLERDILKKATAYFASLEK